MAQQRSKRESYNPLLKSYPDSEKINAVSEGAEVLYVRLIAASDDAGRYWAEPKMVLAKLFTHRALSKTVTAKAVEGRLAELEKIGLIAFYTSGGRRFLQMIKVFKRLRTDIALNLFCPDPDDDRPPPKTLDQALKALADKRSANSQAAEVTSPLRRRPYVGPTSLRPRAVNPTQPYPTQPNPTASADAAGTAAPDGAAHPTGVTASMPSMEREACVVVSNALTPTAAVKATPNLATRDGVATRSSAAQVDGPRDTESDSSSAAVSNRAGRATSAPSAVRSLAEASAAGPPSTAPPGRRTPNFATFWLVYPLRNGRKVGKHLAKKEFKKLAPSDKRLCLEAVQNYAQEMQSGNRIPRDAVKFLEDDYWRDWIGPPAVEPSTKYVDPNSQEAQVWSAE
jgi:hypothetical protein